MISRIFAVVAVILSNIALTSGDGDHTGGQAKPHCISGAEHVRTPTGIKRIDQLSVGDRVAIAEEKDGNYVFEPILTFLHRDALTSGAGLRFTTSNGRNLSLSHKHLTLVAPGQRSVLADKVRLGDSFYVIDSGLETVVEISHTTLEGRYSPVTKSGVILVNDILVSCYSNIEDHHLMHTAVQWLLPYLKSDSIFGGEGVLGDDGLHVIGNMLWRFFRHYFIASS